MPKMPFIQSCWLSTTPSAVHYKNIWIHLREKTTNSVEIHSFARKYEHLCINQIQLQFLQFNQQSIPLNVGIHINYAAHKREKYAFINANNQVMNTVLKVNRDNRQTLKCKLYTLFINIFMTLFTIQ